MIENEQVGNDVDAVTEAHGLRSEQRLRLARIVTGAVPGNRDRPLYLLAQAISRLHHAQNLSFFDLVAAPDTGSGLLLWLGDRALLDFLASMDGYSHFDEVRDAVEKLLAGAGAAEGVRICASRFARALYRYRQQYLPDERHRKVFREIRSFLARAEPARAALGDGDALVFWAAHGTRSHWTTYEAVLSSMMSFADAFELRASRTYASLDDLDLDRMPAGSGTGLSSGECARSLLSEAVARLEEGSLKLFLAKELVQLEQLARLGRFAASWPRSSLAMLALGPLQASAIQRLRTGTARPHTKSAARMNDGYAETLSAYSDLAERARDCLMLVAGTERFDENASVEPMDAVLRELESRDREAAKRIQSMMRRKSFAGIGPDALIEVLDAAQDELLTVAERAGIAARSWARLLKDRSPDLFRDDEAAFLAKLNSLYGTEVWGACDAAV